MGRMTPRPSFFIAQGSARRKDHCGSVFTKSIGSADVTRWRGCFLEAVTVPNGSLARIRGHCETLRQFQAIGGAGIFAEATEHAAGSVIGKRGEDLAASGLIALPAHHDQVLRACQPP